MKIVISSINVSTLRFCTTFRSRVHNSQGIATPVHDPLGVPLRLAALLPGFLSAAAAAAASIPTPPTSLAAVVSSVGSWADEAGTRVVVALGIGTAAGDKTAECAVAVDKVCDAQVTPETKYMCASLKGPMYPNASEE